MGNEFESMCQGEEKYALLVYYAASSGNSLPTFRDKISVPSSKVKNHYSLLGYYSAMGIRCIRAQKMAVLINFVAES
jgi:hypothetical protein